MLTGEVGLKEVVENTKKEKKCAMQQVKKKEKKKEKKFINSNYIYFN